MALNNALPAVGYCQGMNFLAANLFDYLGDEEKAFWAALLAFRRRGLETLYFKGMVALKKACSVLDSLVQRHLPALSLLLVFFAS